MEQQHKIWKALTLFLLLLPTLATAAGGAHPPPTQTNDKEIYDTLWDAVLYGHPWVNFRLRYEGVEQVGKLDADAWTLRTRLGYETAQFGWVSAFIEFSDTAILGTQRFNSGGGTSPTRTAFATVLDPNGALVNRARIDINVPSRINLHIRAGRQRITLDNQRFIGNVGFRQIEQTYDGVSLTLTPLPDVGFFYAYIGRVNRIFGPRAIFPFDHNRVHTHFIHATYGGLPNAHLVGYVYLADNRDIPVFSNNSYGVRLKGHFVPAEYWKLHYVAEYAYQTDATNNPVKYNQSYFHLVFGATFNSWITGQFDWEQLGGDASTPGKAFRTPLATLRKFQGWADLFLVTPAAGINDYYGTLKIKLPIKGTHAIAVYHHFTAESGSTQYGNEVDLGLSYVANRYISFGVQYANFGSKNVMFPNTRKIWAWVSITPDLVIPRS